MDAKDSKGQPLKVGDFILVRAQIIDIAPAGDDAMLVALTATAYGENKTRFAIPTIHGSQVEKVTS